jgi:hypothetical protein
MASESEASKRALEKLDEFRNRDYVPDLRKKNATALYSHAYENGDSETRYVGFIGGLENLKPTFGKLKPSDTKKVMRKVRVSNSEAY